MVRKKQPVYEGIKMRHDPGDWVRMSIRTRTLYTLLGLGFCIGALVVTELANRIAPGELRWPIMVVVMVYLAGVVLYFRMVMPRWMKGAVAERRVGNVIDCAIASPGCATAHSVVTIKGTLGDIDHLVVTPGHIWVIETKYRRVPKRHFAEVLRRLEQNMGAVRKWAATGVDVKARLVLVEGQSGLDTYTTRHKDEEVLCLPPDALLKEIRQAAKEQPSGADKTLARRAFRLSSYSLEENNERHAGKNA